MDSAVWILYICICAYICMCFCVSKKEKETMNLRGGQNQGIQREMPRRSCRKVREKENGIIVET